MAIAINMPTNTIGRHENDKVGPNIPVPVRGDDIVRCRIHGATCRANPRGI